MRSIVALALMLIATVAAHPMLSEEHLARDVAHARLNAPRTPSDTPLVTVRRDDPSTDCEGTDSDGYGVPPPWFKVSNL
ncbi:hypothetical protein FRB99_004758 [Tulasnella sp. 403]|nr:hypothetical protein FRB99_004758 [Tulasnella sp. 403]